MADQLSFEILDRARPARSAEPGVDALLFGSGDVERIVAVEVVGQRAVLLRRATAGAEAAAGLGAGGPADRLSAVSREDRPFRSWLLSTEQQPLPGARWTELPGEGHRWRAEFDAWPEAMAGREALREAGIPVIFYQSPVKQFLMASGQTLFKGMRFEELVRMQVDLETTSLDPNAADARILLIAAGDNHGRNWVLYDEDEAALLQRFVASLNEADPDVIEGHNLFGFDMPYVAARAERLQVPLTIGRDGSELRIGRERNCAVGGTQRSFRPAHVWGRHCIDTMLAAQRFDIGRGELESYGLKECAQVYGLAEAERIILDRSQMSALWRSDAELVRRYALQDIAETRCVADLVTPTEFYQTQMVPDSYQSVAVTGTGEKANSLLVRAYLARGRGIPQSQPPRAYPGGHTEVRRTGVLRQIVKADVESLYPSIMLTDHLGPAADTLDVFLPMLGRLTELRLEAKAAMRAAASQPASAGGQESRENGGRNHRYWDGLQSSFKILINSFYGYLGGPFHFNDYDAAERVTLTGQAIVKQIADRLEATGSQVIEIDTDGVYFTPPPGVQGDEAEQRYVESVAAGLPGGIRLAFDGRYAAMVSLKIKNYVLVDYHGHKTFKGGALRSRADERFGREFIARAVDCLIADDREGVGKLYADLSERLMQGQVPVEQLARRERVTHKTFRSEAKKRSRAAMGEMVVGDSALIYQRIDGSLARIEEYARDEDRYYYADKLRRFAARLEEAIGPEFDRICPRPSRHRAEAMAAGQASLFEP
jgi:DNA polymerase I